MGRAAIEEKLDRHLSSKAPLTEARVVYILVEIRKLLEMLERQEEEDNYPWLRFYCDWALHTKMDRKAAQRILCLFDRVHPLLCANQTLPHGLEQQITEITNLRLFERDFDQFLTDYNLSKDILHDRWTKFVHSYAAVIEDCPLVVKAKGNTLTNINSVTLTKEDAKRKVNAGDERVLLYRISWTCCGVDGTSGTWQSYNTIP